MPPIRSAACVDAEVGDKVEVQWQGKWWLAKVLGRKIAATVSSIATWCSCCTQHGAEAPWPCLRTARTCRAWGTCGTRRHGSRGGEALPPVAEGEANLGGFRGAQRVPVAHPFECAGHRRVHARGELGDRVRREEPGSR